MTTTVLNGTSTHRARSVRGTQIPCFVFDSHEDLARSVAETVAALIRQRNSFGQKTVLGLPTGSTPQGVYRELIHMHREQGLDFSNVVVFSIDEFYGLRADSPQSHRTQMQQRFFRHVNLRPENIHFPDGSVPLEQVEEECRQYEERIQRAGGVDLMLLGIGRDGHIGFNEPYSPRQGRTQLVTLDPGTRADLANQFFGKENVPTQAITMGLGTILEARKIILMALGEHKAEVVRKAAEEPAGEHLPASLLRHHSDAAFLLDEAAAAQLSAVATPWKLGPVSWTDPLVKRAVLWLCEQTGKALLKLDDDDFRAHGLHQLLREQGPASRLAHRVFRWMMDTIVYHPAGKEPQRVLVFSPHPDDDVISMGGTLIRLVQDGHEVHVAYMTSGNIAVFDHDAQRLVDLVAEFNRRFGIDEEKSVQFEQRVLEHLRNKRPGEPDHPDVQRIKELIRWSEAKAAAAVCGCKEEHLHFLDMPFYKTGQVDKKPIGEEDVRIVLELIRRVQPSQVYIAGDLSDPHGTHRLCAQAILAALEELRRAGEPVPEALLYRGAWQEWPLHQIELAVPLSPRDLEQKKIAIFRHESQKDTAPFPGTDSREFWQRAEDRNRHTAESYNRIGLPEYFAMEAFVRWRGQPL